MAGSKQQHFTLEWADFQSNIVSSFRHLREENVFTDVTLACGGRSIQAHRIVLSACSSYFKSLLAENSSKYPIIFLTAVPFEHLQAILDFMYTGEVDVAEDQLSTFLETANSLKVKGLLGATRDQTQN